MDFMEAREMVHLRYELRRMLAERRFKEAHPLLTRLKTLAAAHEEERGVLEPEIERWETSFAR